MGSRTDEVRRLAQLALDAPTVRAAVDGGRYRRKVYVGAVVDNVLVEGFIDLLYEDADGYVVVDYKTDALPDEGAIDDAVPQRSRVRRRDLSMLSAVVASCVKLRDGTEVAVRLYRLLRRVGAGVALGHREVGVAEEHLYVDLTCPRLDRPRREGVSKAVRVNLLHPHRVADAAKDDPQRVPGGQCLAKRRKEEHSLPLTAEAFDVVAKR